MNSFLRTLATVVLIAGWFEGLGAFNALMNTPDDLAVASAAVLFVCGIFGSAWILRALWLKPLTNLIQKIKGNS